MGERGVQGFFLLARLHAKNLLMEFASPRAWAFTSIGIQYCLRRFPGDRAVLGMQNALVQKLLDLYQENGTDDLALVSGHRHSLQPVPAAGTPALQANDDQPAISIGLESLTWLVKIQQ